MKVSDILEVDSIELHLKATRKRELLHEMIQLLHGTHPISNVNEVERELIKRETVASTGIGDGIAIPHLLTSGVTTTMMAIGIKQGGIKYSSIDGNPVQLVFLIVGPQGQEPQHLRLLCGLSRLLRDARTKSRLLAAQTREEIKNLVSEFEDRQSHECYPQMENN